MMKTRLFCLILLFVILQRTQAYWEWKTYTSTLQVRKITAADGRIWCATEGGLLSYDPASSEFVTWTNTEGLASVDITALTTDDADNLWIGMQNGTLQRYNPETHIWFTVNEFDNHPVLSLAPHGDSLFVGLDIGISLYIISRNEVKETYRRLGHVVQPEQAVQGMSIQRGRLWAITDQGVSFAALDAVNLLDPRFWDNESMAEGLPSGGIFSLKMMRGMPVAATSTGVFLRGDHGWAHIAGTQTDRIVDLEPVGEALYILAENRLDFWNGQTSTVLARGSHFNSLFIDDNVIYLGTNQGMLRIENGDIASIQPNCPGGNIFSDMAVDQDGALWCASGNLNGSVGYGLFKYEEGHWTVYSKTNLPILQRDVTTSVFVDNLNRKWIGTYGSGLVMLSDTDTLAFRPNTGHFSGLSNDADFSVIRSVTGDLQGTLWALNNSAVSGDPLVAINPDSSWTYFGQRDGMTSVYVWDIAVDAYNRKWISTHWVGGNANGVYVIDDKYTPFNKGDDGNIGTLTKNDGLASNNVPAIVVDQDNIVWMGTDAGLFYYSNNEVRERYGLPSENIRALMVDGANNLWVGTDAGVSYFSVESYDWITFTSKNSPLVSNEVISLSSNMKNGDVFIGTSSGLSVVSTPYSAPLEAFEPLHMYPNPFQPDIHANLYIENLPDKVGVSIFTSNGYLVFKKEPNRVFGNTYVWDGKDGDGNTVSAGIYLVVVSQMDGSAEIGKIAVVR